MTDADRIDHIRKSMPQAGLFQDKEWQLSPRPFPLPSRILRWLHALGPALRAFQRACDDLYHTSLMDPNLAWISHLLDQGKPAQVVELGRHLRWRQQLSAVLRPDLVLTAEGLTLVEIDSLPGGIGLTAWLNETYAALNEPVIGGPTGMMEGFAAAFPEENILISRESADYQPEMEWLVSRLNRMAVSPQRRVFNPWQLVPSNLPKSKFYRFFELFDLGNVEHSQEILDLAKQGLLNLSPPLKAYLEEKLWLVLFHCPQLQDWWQETIAAHHLDVLSQCIPQGWVVDPSPLPPHALRPGLEIYDWEELRRAGSRQRELALKISGFSELGWGSRSVSIGHDLSQTEWSYALDAALESYPRNPYILQQFHHGVSIQHPAWADEQQTTHLMKARVRLCPYYFIPEGTETTQLSGILATICPADKKILHGMRDALMLPCIPIVD